MNFPDMEDNTTVSVSSEVTETFEVLSEVDDIAELEMSKADSAFVDESNADSDSYHSKSSNASKSSQGDSKSGSTSISSKESSADTGAASTNYPVTFFSDSQWHLIDAIMLAQWDNIMGPKIRQLWLPHSVSSSSTSFLSDCSYLARYTLSGEVCRDVFERAIDSKIYMIPDRSLLVHTFVFSAIANNDLALHTLVFIVPLKYKEMHKAYYEFIDANLQLPLMVLRVLLEKASFQSAISTFTTSLRSFMQTLIYLRDNTIQPNIQLHDTLFHSSSAIPEGFLRRAILSHLMTSHRTLVRGHHLPAVNKMVSTLALFLSDSERQLSCYAVQTKHWQYNPHLLLQGIPLDTTCAASLDLSAACYCSTPTTLIDLTRQEVLQSPPHHRHAILTHHATCQKLKARWTETTAINVNLHRDLFKPIELQETLVTKFFAELSLLPENGGRKQAYCKQLRRMLMVKALAFITACNTESNNGAKLITKDNNLKKIRHDLGLAASADFSVVLAVAEKLKPGIYTYVRGDSKRDLDKVLQLIG